MTSSDEPEAVADLPGEELEDDTQPPASPASERTLTTLDDRLSLTGADGIARKRGLQTTLIAGEIKTGKTTLLVALWDEFMTAGKIGDVRFAGSRTALAFERRSWLSRVASGGTMAETDRTFFSTSGWIHVRVQTAAGRLRELLLSDLSGEYFEKIRQGEPAGEVLPDLERVDRLLVVVDGAAMVDSAQRGMAASSARRIVDQIRTTATTDPAMRVAVVLTKSDRVTDGFRERWEAIRADLLTRAQRLDPCAQVFETAARPQDGSDPTGLAAIIEFMSSEPSKVPAVEMAPTQPRRTIGQFK